MNNASDAKSDKDKILTEFSKTGTRLKNQGVDMSGVHFGINEKIRNPKPPKPIDIREKLEEFKKSERREVENQKEETDEKIPEGHVVWKPEDDFIKLYPEALNRISFKLSGAEAMTLIRLISYIDYQSGMLKKDKKPLIAKDIIEITKFSKVTVIGIMEKLVDERILSKTRVGRTFEFFVNPYIFFKGRYINNTLLDMFKDYKNKK